MLQAFCNTASFPAGMAILQTMVNEYGINDGKIPPSSMSLILITNNITAALGPVLGGYLVTDAGWKSIFWINAPINAVIFVLYMLMARTSGRGRPANRRTHHAAAARIWRGRDPSGCPSYRPFLL
ncbi:MFS transporter [Paenibacillus sp. P25]|nr:MFS transporter [Paenibacillus sp. P25]